MQSESDNKQRVTYRPSKTMELFHASTAETRCIMGPIGSGKSVACTMEVLNKAMHFPPDRDGCRKTRWAVVRNTYPELKSTTIQTWTDWIPESVCPITYGAPIEGRMIQRLPDGTMMDMHVYFISLDKPKDAKKVLSLELTGAWINEVREMDESLVRAVLSRTGRFPKGGDLPEDTATPWSGLIVDTNPPDDDHWYYRLAEKVKPDNWAFFRQPPAIVRITDHRGRVIGYEANPDAENVKNIPLGYRYWMRHTQSADPEWIKVHCCGEYGTVFDGKPVYGGSFNDFVHVSPRPLGLFKGLPIQLGWDFGLTPACIIGQISPNGQLRILRELVCKRGGIKQFATDVVKPTLVTLFPGVPVASWADPAGMQASQVDETTCIAQLGVLGIPTKPTQTNDFLPRRQAVLDWLTRTIDGKPAFIVDPSCKTIISGFRGGYHFERVQVSGEQRYRDKPAKNRFSHPHDALQYLCLGTTEVPVVETRRSAPPPPSASVAWAGSV